MSRGGCAKVGSQGTAALAGVAGTLGLAAPAAAADPALLGQWRFDEGSGQVAVDDGPQRLSGLLGSADVPDAADPGRIDGASGRALRFDGSAFVRLPDTPTLAVADALGRSRRARRREPGLVALPGVPRGPGVPGGLLRPVHGRGRRDRALRVRRTRYVVSATARPDGRLERCVAPRRGHLRRRRAAAVRRRPPGRRADGGAPADRVRRRRRPRASFGQYVGNCELSFRGDMDLVRLWSGARPAGGRSPRPPPAFLPLPRRATAAGRRRGDGHPRRRRGSAGPGLAGGRPRACVVRVLRRRAAGKRRTVVHVRVTMRKRPLQGTRVVARRAGRQKVLASKRTNAKGRARLALRAPRSRTREHHREGAPAVHAGARARPMSRARQPRLGARRRGRRGDRRAQPSVRPGSSRRRCGGRAPAAGRRPARRSASPGPPR